MSEFKWISVDSNENPDEGEHVLVLDENGDWHDVEFSFGEFWDFREGREFTHWARVPDLPKPQPVGVWVSVEEDLPEPEEYVLVKPKSGGFVTTHFNHNWSASTITHWCRIQEPE
jgi:hypothetical protein